MRVKMRCAEIFFPGLFIAGFLILSSGRCEGAVKYVTQGGGGNRSGSSWSNALGESQFISALASASSGTEFWVAEGRYRPAVTLQRSASFVLKTGVTLYGGFAGTETDRDQRDPEVNVTVLTGDLGLDDTVNGHGVTVTPSGINGSNSYSVVKAVNVSHTAVLDGFTVTGGKADDVSAGSPDTSGSYGGGLYAVTASAMVTGCSFVGNTAYWGGGGICGTESSLVLTHCVFSGNVARDGGGFYNDSGNPLMAECSFVENTGTLTGGGLYCTAGSPELSNCVFSGNRAGDGGGMHNYNGSNPILTDCVFSENTAEKSGGGMANVSGCSPELTGCSFVDNRAGDPSMGGGAMANSVSSPVISLCTFSGNSAAARGGALYGYSSSCTVSGSSFSGNSADSGGGVYERESSGSPSFSECTFSGNTARMGGAMYNLTSSPVLHACTFSENTASDSGGGMYNYDRSRPVLTECTFSENSAKRGGGMGNTHESNASMTGCTFSGNTAEADHGGGIINSGSSTEIRGCTFNGNYAEDMGGGVFNLMADTEMENCTFYGNIGSRGGALASFESVSTVWNCTFRGDYAANGAGLFNYSSSASVKNSILWHTAGGEISNEGGSSAAVQYSIVRGGYPGTGNIPEDPMLSPLAWNGGPTKTCAISAGSPAMDKGTSAGAPGEDQRGVSRPQKNGYDMGAYEVWNRKVAVIKASIGGAVHFETAGMDFPSGMGNARSFPEGTSLTVTFAPEKGKSVLNVFVDEVEIGPVSSCTFPAMDRDHFVEVIFGDAPPSSGGGCSAAGFSWLLLFILPPALLAAGKSRARPGG